jgi:hypothetical protein
MSSRQDHSPETIRHPELVEGSASGDILHPGNVRIKVPCEGEISQKVGWLVNAVHLRALILRQAQDDKIQKRDFRRRLNLLSGCRRQQEAIHRRGGPISSGVVGASHRDSYLKLHWGTPLSAQIHCR